MVKHCLLANYVLFFRMKRRRSAINGKCTCSFFWLFSCLISSFPLLLWIFLALVAALYWNKVDIETTSCQSCIIFLKNLYFTTLKAFTHYLIISHLLFHRLVDSRESLRRSPDLETWVCAEELWIQFCSRRAYRYKYILYMILATTCCLNSSSVNRFGWKHLINEYM